MCADFDWPAVEDSPGNILGSGGPEPGRLGPLGLSASTVRHRFRRDKPVAVAVAVATDSAARDGDSREHLLDDVLGAVAPENGGRGERQPVREDRDGKPLHVVRPHMVAA
ncbi:hypothetical protein Ga0074812_1665 [Parafrankia irregularis]|uniref:Uncharacterized protein n=1 Tax=Parafrankia irregularis TaxID=795642 RepID=A0A0S4R233_9ACTN|nr:hypothetical protein Ga0074812_1665 [Parafrankia irregularis]